MRRFAAKAAFEFRESYHSAREPKVIYEIRVLTLEARSAEAALRKMKRLCEMDQWSAAPAKHIKSQAQKFLGLIAFNEITFLDAHEVWWEYVSTKPRLGRLGAKQIPNKFRGSARQLSRK